MITLAMPSTRKNTTSRIASVVTATPVWRMNRMPVTSDTAAENSCSQKCGTRPAAIRLIACTRPPTIRIQPRNQVSASDDISG